MVPSKSTLPPLEQIIRPNVAALYLLHCTPCICWWSKHMPFIDFVTFGWTIVLTMPSLATVSADISAYIESVGNDWENRRTTRKQLTFSNSTDRISLILYLYRVGQSKELHKIEKKNLTVESALNKIQNLDKDGLWRMSWHFYQKFMELNNIVLLSS